MPLAQNIVYTDFGKTRGQLQLAVGHLAPQLLRQSAAVSHAARPQPFLARGWK
jgi:hypothetical protein